MAQAITVLMLVGMMGSAVGENSTMIPRVACLYGDGDQYIGVSSCYQDPYRQRRCPPLPPHTIWDAINFDDDDTCVAYVQASQQEGVQEHQEAWKNFLLYDYYCTSCPSNGLQASSGGFWNWMKAHWKPISESIVTAGCIGGAAAGCTTIVGCAPVVGACATTLGVIHHWEVPLNSTGVGDMPPIFA